MCGGMGPPSTALDAISCPYMEWFECELEADKSRGRDKVGLSEWQARLTRGPKCTDMSPAEEWFSFSLHASGFTSH